MHAPLLSQTALEHLLCALILLSRLADIGSTWLVSPTLKLEANPVVRKLGWWYALATVLVCLIPYYSTAYGIAVLIPSLMVSAGNTKKIWFARAYGEAEYDELMLRLARKSRLSHALAPMIAAAGLIASIGFVLVLLCPDPARDWGYWFGFGFIAYGIVICIHGSLFFVRLFRRAAQGSAGAAVPAGKTLTAGRLVPLRAGEPGATAFAENKPAAQPRT